MSTLVTACGYFSSFFFTSHFRGKCMSACVSPSTLQRLVNSRLQKAPMFHSYFRAVAPLFSGKAVRGLWRGGGCCSAYCRLPNWPLRYDCAAPLQSCCASVTCWYVFPLLFKFDFPPRRLSSGCRAVIDTGEPRLHPPHTHTCTHIHTHTQSLPLPLRQPLTRRADVDVELCTCTHISENVGYSIQPEQNTAVVLVHPPSMLQ